MHVPEMPDARSLARNDISSATSEVVAARPGWDYSIRATTSSRESPRSRI